MPSASLNNYSYKMPVLSPRHSTTLTGYRTTFSSTSVSRPYYNSSNYTSPRITSYSERFSSKYSTEDTTSRYDRDKSTRRESLSRDSTRSSSIHDREMSLPRSESRERERSSLSTLSMVESVADLRSKYSPANYVPAVLRRDISRSKSINDIGRPPLEAKNSIKTTKKVTENANSVTNTTNTDNNGNNRPSVAEIRKKFDRKSSPDAKNDLLVGGNKIYSRPAKCVKINDVNLQEPEKCKEDTPVNDNLTSMDVSDAKIHNHTTNFASYIPSKDLDEKSDENNQQNLKNDISTSPRLNRLQSSSNSLSLSPGSRASPPSALRDDHGPSGRTLGLNGLKNIGNTCFMNSVVQCLSNTRYLLEYVKGDEYMDDINTSLSGMKGALIKAFSLVIQELWSPASSDRVVNTVALKSQIQRFAPRFMGYAQQDAQEFLRYLLEGLHEDVNRVVTKPAPILTEIDEKLSDGQKAAEAWHRYLRMDNSRVVDIFVGQLKSTLRCTHCGHESVTFDPFWDLSLPIPQRQGTLRLGQCLEHFTREETLDGDEKPTCAKCKERRKCTKSFSIQKFPRILVIHLKRFSPTERFRGKLNLVIDFPLQGLDLSAFAAAAATDCVYNLYAISNHSGTTYSGHYTAYCKHPYLGQWHEYNDSRVSSISPKNVVSSEAYVLFYELVGAHPHL